MNPRLIATYLIKQVVEEKLMLTYALSNNKYFNNSGKDKALIQELCYGTIRWHIQLLFLVKILLNKEIKKKNNTVIYLILIGLYQLKYMNIPAHAVINETVETCNSLNKSWAKKLVNAVLRRYQREASSLQEKLNSSIQATYSHPKWLIDKIQKDWPCDWQNIINANNQRPPMYIRVNQQKISRNDYVKTLATQNIQCTTTPNCHCGLLLATPVDVNNLPGFEEGLVSVQELAAQFAAQFLDLKEGQTVLDACAAPGGKSAHILETEPKLKKFIVVEKNKIRAKKLKETLARIGFDPLLIIDDIQNKNNWWDGNLFDRILLDAPCSATGVIRRHPDVKLSRTEESILKISTLQYKLLDTLWQLLKPGGLILYATCSVLKQENDDIIKKFNFNHNNSTLKKIDCEYGVNTEYGKQFLTGENNMDGFFYSCIKKQ